MINLKSKINTIQKILNNLKEDHISEYSAQCAYYVMLSFIPFIISFLSINIILN